MTRLSCASCILFAIFVLHSTVLGFQDSNRTINVSVNGSSNPEDCSTKGDCSLTAAFHAVMEQKKFKSSTQIRIARGNYKLNESFIFNNLDSLSLTATVASADGPVSVIQCEGNNSGLSFYKCRNILIQGISLVSCGALYNSSSYNNPLFYSALFINYNVGFKLSNVAIVQSLGIGVTIYDTTGNVTIENVVFDKNGPNSINCRHYISMSGLVDGKNIATSGGGLSIDFTYNNTEGYVNSSYYRILRSTFNGNTSPFPNLLNDTFIRPGGVKHVGFGRGGGLSLYLRGSAYKNTFWIDSNIFQDNQAVWGGGYFIQFLDNVKDNSVIIFNTTVTGNSACFGGGAFELSDISVTGQSERFAPNRLHSTFCSFYSNSAVSGGGGTIFGRTSIGHEDNSYYFTNCTWDRNKAVIGSAITLKLWDYDQGLFGPNSPFKVKLTDCNIIKNTLRENSTEELGLGAVYDFLVPLFLRNVNFTGNTNTSLVLDTSSVTIMERVIFSQNTGFKGGAVAMYGEASFNLTKGSRLIFEANVAKEKGGAIFVDSPGPAFIPAVFNNYLPTHECFFKYENKNANPNDWQAQVVFIDNTAPFAAGYSVFAKTLQDCLYHSDSNTSTVLQWSSFHYYTSNSSNSTSKRSYEITTATVKITSKRSEWRVPPGQTFSPTVKLLDEKNNSVYGIVDVSIIPAIQNSPVKLGTPSPLFLVKDNISFVELKGVPERNFSVKIRTVGDRLAYANLESITLIKCNPGFVQKDDKCVCLSVDRFSGVSRCSEDGTTVYLEKGYWAGEVQSESGQKEFVTAQCPTGYCNCVRPNDGTSLRTAECVYNSSLMCKGHRTDVLCGRCKQGYDVVVGVQECSTKCHNSDLWRLAPLLLFLTALVFIIFKINLDIFTCYMNAWLYFYQVVILIMSVREEVPLDPFIQFIIGLANVTIDGFGSCMWKDMDNLLKLGFNYLLPVYVFIVVLVIGLFARRFPNSYFARKSRFRASCTLFVLSYSTLTRISMQILQPSDIAGTKVVFYQGTVKYFSTYHAYFAVPAILILLFVVIPFPVILTFTPFFMKQVRCVSYATPLFSTFQGCFKDGCRWFAAFYFFCRFFLLLFDTFIPDGEGKAAVIQISCVLVLSVHIYLCPYLPQYDWINKLDSLLLIALTIISIISGQITKYNSETSTNAMVIIINILLYIPLVYAVLLAIYLLNSWIKVKLKSFTKLQEGNDINSGKVI